MRKESKEIPKRQIEFRGGGVHTRSRRRCRRATLPLEVLRPPSVQKRRGKPRPSHRLTARVEHPVRIPIANSIRQARYTQEEPTCQYIVPYKSTRAVQFGGVGMVWWEPRRSREQEAPVHDLGERWVFRNPPVEMVCSICFSASLVHSCPDHTHPPRKIRWREFKLGTIDLYAFFVFSIDVEVKFGKIDQTVGP